MIRVRAPSRLHFGLLSLPAEELSTAPQLDLLPARHFGGVGLMVQEPGVQLTGRSAPAWSAEGPLAERALAFAQRFSRAVSEEGVVPPPHPHHFVLGGMAAEHTGLGTGTQLGLAVARALADCGLKMTRMVLPEGHAGALNKATSGLAVGITTGVLPVTSGFT